MLTIKITNDKQNHLVDHAGGPLELGRGPQRDIKRIMIEDGGVSRDQLRVEPLAGGRLRIDNLSLKIPVVLPDGSEVPMGGNRELMPPIALSVGNTVIEIRLAGASKGPAAANSFANRPTITPTPPPPSPTAVTSPRQPALSAGRAGGPAFAAPPEVDPMAVTGDVPAWLATIDQPVRSAGRGRPVPKMADLNESTSPEQMAQWLETVVNLQRGAGTAEEIYLQTAQALVGLVNLDVGLVLMRKGDKWQVVARAARDEGRETVGREFSTTLLRHVVMERRTFFQDPGSLGSQESLRNVDAVVVSPVFGLEEDDVVGVVYGSRRSNPVKKSGGIRPLDAQLVQLLAAVVGATLARDKATRFEQFVAPEVARELDRDPGLLEGRGLEVTILMSDIRGFSRLSEKLGPENACRLVRDVMDRLSARIVEHKGTIVNYLGDGILAMWNAPTKQEGHALLACRAALAMQQEVPGLNSKWQELVGQPLAIGIGLNTGPAQVGNTGSQKRMMYGPLGHTVNLASRVEGATKQLGVPILVTGSTRSFLGDAFASRRLCKVHVVGIAEAVELYELHGEQATPEWQSFRDTYEAALALYETQQWSKACQTLTPLLQMGDQLGYYDKPTLKLMRRAYECLESAPEPFDPVLELSVK